MAAYHPPPQNAKPKGLGLPPTVASAFARKSSKMLSQANMKDLRESNRSTMNLRSGLPKMNDSQQQRPGSDLGSYGLGTSSAYPGMLPTLGLTKYKEADLTINQRNPYRIQNDTEKLLVFQERQREFRDFNKLEKEGQRVFEKNLASRPTRRGVIREIRGIKSSSSAAKLALKGKLKAQNQNEDQP